MTYWPVSTRWKPSGSIQRHADGHACISPLALLLRLWRTARGEEQLCAHVIIWHSLTFLPSLSVHNLEFCPKEPVWAVQKDRQLLFPHHFSGSGNKTRPVLVCWRHQSCVLRFPALNTNVCACTGVSDSRLTEAQVCLSIKTLHPHVY